MLSYVWRNDRLVLIISKSKNTVKVDNIIPRKVIAHMSQKFFSGSTGGNDVTPPRLTVWKSVDDVSVLADVVADVLE